MLGGQADGRTRGGIHRNSIGNKRGDQVLILSSGAYRGPHTHFLYFPLTISPSLSACYVVIGWLVAGPAVDGCICARVCMCVCAGYAWRRGAAILRHVGESS